MAVKPDDILGAAVAYFKVFFSTCEHTTKTSKHDPQAKAVRIDLRYI